MKKDEIKRYIELMYNQKSELNHIEDLQERKIQAAIKAKLDPNDPETIKIMELRNEKVTVDIVNYLNRCNPNDYVKLISDQQLFWNMQQHLMKPIDDSTDVNKLMVMSEKSVELVERIKDGYYRTYRQPELIEQAQKVIRMISPEMRLKEKKNMA